jgi:hypothetical protein
VAGIVIAPAAAAPALVSCVVVGDTVTWVFGAWRGTTTYTLTIPSQVSSVAGVALPANYPWSFTTRTGQPVSLPLVVIPGSAGFAVAPDPGVWGTVTGAPLYVGDCNTVGTATPAPCLGLTTGTGFVQARFRAFSAFALPGILVGPPAALVQTAVLTVPLLSLTLTDMFNPIFGGGPIHVERVDYWDNVSLEPSDFYMSPVGADVPAITGGFIGPNMVTITGMVNTALGNPAVTLPTLTPYLGVRFKWIAGSLTTFPNTDYPSYLDNDVATLGTLALVVTYWH